MPRNLGLALAKDFDEIADTNLPAVHQVEKPHAGPVGESSEQQGQIVRFQGTVHNFVIYVLTNMSSWRYIRFSVCEETLLWKQRQPFRSR